MKMIAIFSENRPEWFMTVLACCSTSICVVPIAVDDMFMREERIQNILDLTQIETICISVKTIGMILDIKSKGKLEHLKNLILFDYADDIHITLASQVGFNVYCFQDLVLHDYASEA